MPRLHVLIEIPDDTPDAEARTRRLVDELTRTAGDGTGLELGTGGGSQLVDVVAVTEPGRGEGLVLNVAAVDDYGQARRELRDLTRATFPEFGVNVDGPATQRRTLDGVAAVFIVAEQRFATPLETRRVVAALRASLTRR